MPRPPTGSRYFFWYSLSMVAVITALCIAKLTAADKIVASARDQCTWGTRYDPAYFSIAYPGGDLPKTKGVCTDVVVRSLRSAGYDLQVLVHEDMKRNWSAYPKLWGATKPDKNIDHRRTPNQMTYFGRFGQKVTTAVTERTKNEWKPGDIVFWNLTPTIKHVGIVSDNRNASGWPYVIHNLSTTREEDVLTSWPIIGHYRFPKPR